MKSIDFVCNQSVFWPLIFNTLLVFVLSPARSWIKILWSWAGCIFAGISILIPPYSNIPLGCWVGGNNRRLLVFFSNCGYFLVDSLKLLTNRSILWFQNKWIQRSLFLSVNLIIDFVIFCLPKETYHLLIQILILWKKNCGSLLFEVLNCLPDLHLSITYVSFYTDSFYRKCFEFLTNMNPIDSVFLVFALFMLFAFAPEQSYR